MEYKIYMPSGTLSKQVKYYWSLESAKGDKGSGRERIFPDGCIELIFHYGNLFRKYDTPQTFHIQPRSFIHGQIKSYIEIEPTGTVGIFSARFNPAGLQPFIDFDVDSFTGRTLSVEEIWGSEGVVLENEMLACYGNDERVTVIEDFLLKKRQDLKIDNTPVEYCVEALFKSVGAVSIESLAEELRIGKRQLERRFIAAVGLSPKVLARIIRFQNTLQLIENKEFRSFTGVAHEGGFYDQAHFIKDFRDFTGLNPKQYFSENLEMAKHFSFDE